MAEQWTDARMRTLEVLCDTYIPAVAPPDVEAHDPTGFWGRTASDLEVAPRLRDWLDEDASEKDRDGLLKLLDLLRFSGFNLMPQGAKEGLLRALHRANDDIALGLDTFRGGAMMLFYGAQAPDGDANPNWEQLGYPGPPELPDARTRGRRIEVFRPAADGAVRLDCDVVVIGSGSGGGVIAGTLAQEGLDVVVLEAGGHHEDADFPVHEVEAYRTLYWNGGYTPTDDGNVTVVAGQTLGGGSTVNWTNCVRPDDHVREEWAREHGLDGLDGPEFDEHLEAVAKRIGIAAGFSDANDPNLRLREGAEKLGWATTDTVRNLDPDSYSPETAGFMGRGDRTGSKQGTLKTYLEDAADAGARILVDCRAVTVLIRDGRAAGVEARMARPAPAVAGRDGRREPVQIPVVVNARHVVVAGGAFETPALLLRSGIGGPAVGNYLRLHPVPVSVGYYREPQTKWWGPPQTVLMPQFTDAHDGYGYLLEVPIADPGLATSGLPWRSARDNKLLAGRFGHSAVFISLTRDRGHGRVAIDADGEPLITYPLDDELDLRHLREGVEAMIRIHEAAGASTILDMHPSRPVWSRRQGDDLDAFIGEVTGLGFGHRQRPVYSAHQTGSARMGRDPETSVADPDGQLHDTPGVWIGDGSAFPTAVGTHPMLTIMALARRTAHAILAAD